MFYCYILESHRNHRFYVGHAQDLDRRLHDHNRGHVTATRNKGPWKVVHYEGFATRAMASRREREIKGWKSAALIRELIAGSGLGRPDNREGR